MDSEWTESLQNFSAGCSTLCSGICHIRERRSLARDELPAAEVTLPIFALVVWNQAQFTGCCCLRPRKAGKPQQRPDQRMRSCTEAKVATQSSYTRAVQAFQHRRESDEGCPSVCS